MVFGKVDGIGNPEGNIAAITIGQKADGFPGVREHSM